MVDEQAAERVVRWAAEAAADGADVVLGGTRDGATVAPTIVAHPPAAAAVVTHEVFGALVAVLPYDGFADVIATCNASRYGLQAGLFTRDIGRDPHRLARTAGRRADRQRLVQLPLGPCALRRGQGLRLRPRVAALDDRRLHRHQDAAPARASPSGADT